MYMSPDKKTNKLKYQYLFHAVRKFINDFDPLGLFVAPFDEYDGLCHSVFSVLCTTRFGFQKADCNLKKENFIKKVFDFDAYAYFPECLDWVNEETGEQLSAYTPDHKLENLLNHRINKNLE